MNNYAIMCKSRGMEYMQVSWWIWTDMITDHKTPLMNYATAKDRYSPTELRGETIVAVIRLE